MLVYDDAARACVCDSSVWLHCGCAGMRWPHEFPRCATHSNESFQRRIALHRPYLIVKCYEVKVARIPTQGRACAVAVPAVDVCRHVEQRPAARKVAAGSACGAGRKHACKTLPDNGTGRAELDGKDKPVPHRRHGQGTLRVVWWLLDLIVSQHICQYNGQPGIWATWHMGWHLSCRRRTCASLGGQQSFPIRAGQGQQLSLRVHIIQPPTAAFRAFIPGQHGGCDIFRACIVIASSTVWWQQQFAWQAATCGTGVEGGVPGHIP